ncbi:MAG: hypothetical protein C6I01_06775 [Epsilonproteobacteria bacterium]|nr:hypothetical protein [Campylobacterota bacterium]
MKLNSYFSIFSADFPYSKFILSPLYWLFTPPPSPVKNLPSGENGLRLEIISGFTTSLFWD